MNQRMLLAGVAAAILGVTLVSQTDAQIKQGKSRPLTTKQMMAGLVGPKCGEVSKAFEGGGPQDDKAWEAAATNAALLNETGYSLMDDGRCPDATWANASKQMRDATATLLTKIQARDASGARETIPMLLASCKSCHTAHKK